MSSQLIDARRVRTLNDASPRNGSYVMYWMQQSQRAQSNHALEFAVRQANDRSEKLLVAFSLMDDYPEANQRHYRFMLEGLQDVAAALADRGVKFVVQKGHPVDVAAQLASDASIVVCDRGYLRHQKAWRETLAERIDVQLVEVESDVVVPVDVASDKAEYAARTIRPKVRRHWSEFLTPLRSTPLKKDSLAISIEGLDLADLDRTLASLTLDSSVPPVTRFFRGGGSEARKLLRRFREHRLADYDDNRNQPQLDYVSHMSKYLHFGQISPIELALTIDGATSKPAGDRDSFLEELLVRRELAINFVNFEPHYDSWRGLPAWARTTLVDHKGDEREFAYSRSELEDAQTHDPYWNAAMREMRYTGYMHNYMRMYWGKKILEWTNTPQHAYATALAINNKYFLDGRDANSFANIAWVFGRHDRPWKERAIFGKVRYMNAGGLERKCDIGAYVEKVDRLVEQATSSS